MSQQQGAGYIGKLVADGTLEEGRPLHAALHAIVACAGAAASSQSCQSGAAGASASSLLTGLFSDADPKETNSEREAKRNLITSLVTGIATVSGETGSTASAAAVASVDNNWLATQQIVQMKKELAAADGMLETLQVSGKWMVVSKQQDLLTKVGVAKGLAKAGVDDLKGMGEFLLHPVESVMGLGQLLTPEVRKQIGNEMYDELKAKIARVAYAIEHGGYDNAEKLGEDLGELAWQVGSVASGVGGAAKGVVVVGKAGTKGAKVAIDFSKRAWNERKINKTHDASSRKKSKQSA